MLRKRNTPSGKFVLRIEPELHQQLIKVSRENQSSLNEQCNTILKAALSLKNGAGSGVDGPLISAIQREFGALTEGIVLFGSQAREQATASSDIDLLIVINAPVDRSCYKKWDDSIYIEKACSRFDRPVNPQFVRMISDAGEAGGIWLEAALEGRILWDPVQQIHQKFVAIRKAIVDGYFTRAVAHGHPYWIRKKAAQT